MNKLARYIIIAVSVATIGYILWFFNNIVWYIIIAMVVSLMGRPIVQLLRRIHIGKWRCPYSLGAAIALVTLFVFFGMLFRSFFPLVATQFEELRGVDPKQLMETFSTSLATLDESLASILPVQAKQFSLVEEVQNQVASFLDADLFRSLFSSTATFISDLLVALFSISFIAFFFMKDDGLFVHGLTFFFPQKFEENIVHAVSRSELLLRRYFIGLILESFVITILTVIGMLILGFSLNTALVIGIMAGVLNVIPYIGALISLGIALLISLALASTGAAPMSLSSLILFIIIVFVVVRFIDNFFLQPYIYSSSAQAHPLEIFIVLLMASQLAGMLGMFLAIPVYTIARVVGKEFFSNFHIVQRLTKNI